MSEIDKVGFEESVIEFAEAILEKEMADARFLLAEAKYLMVLATYGVEHRRSIDVGQANGRIVVWQDGPSRTWQTATIKGARLAVLLLIWGLLLAGLPGCCGPGWQLSYAPAPPPVVRVCQPEADCPTVTLPAPPTVPALAPPPPPALPAAIPSPPAPPLVKPSALADEDLTPRTDVWIGQAAASRPWRRPTR